MFTFYFQSISISAGLLVKQRKKLLNILIGHESLELLLDILEHSSGLFFFLKKVKPEQIKT